MKLRYALVLVCCSTALATAPVVDTKYHDSLDKAHLAPLAGDDLGSGQSVALFNGNLHIAGPSSPVFTDDNQLSLGLTRAYNSVNVRLEKVRVPDQNGAETWKSKLLGPTWSGLGWITHLGRIYHNPLYTASASGWSYSGLQQIYEDPMGFLLRFDPSIDQASPHLLFKEFPDCRVPQDPPTPPWCCTHDKCPDSPKCDWNDPCDGRQGEPPYYLMYDEAGNKVRFDEIVPEIADASGWITNRSHGGFYPTQLTDLYGNTVTITYQYAACIAAATNAADKEICNTKYPYREAIKQITSPHYTINVEVYQSADTSDTNLIGMLRQIRAKTYQGTASTPLEMLVDFGYETTTVQDDDGSHVVPLLHTVHVYGSDGSDGGTTTYDYGQAVGGTAPYSWNALLDRVTDPLGATSEYEYTQFTSGLRPPDGQARTVTGIKRRILHTSAGQSEWSWSRDHLCTGGCTTASMPPTGCTNKFDLVLPDARIARSTFWGDMCGRDDVDGSSGWGVPGLLHTTTYLAANTEIPSTLSVSYDYYVEEHDPQTGEVVKMDAKNRVTSYLDDDGNGCFDVAADSAHALKMTETRDIRNTLGYWMRTTVDGDYLELGTGSSIAHVTDVDYESSEDMSSAHKTSHVLGTYRSVSEIEGQFVAKTVTSFDAKGKLVGVTRRWAWAGAASADDPVTSAGYDGVGNCSSMSSSGVSKYPDGATSANTYSATAQYQRGTLSNVQSTGAPIPSLNITVDTYGAPSTVLDQKGNATVMVYDALRRVKAVTPPRGLGKDIASTRTSYPDLWHAITVTARDAAASTFDGTDTQQVYADVTLDEFGRVTRERRANPDGSLVLRVTKYDHLGRVVFVSNWIEGEHPASSDWSTPSLGATVNWTHGSYSITGVPTRGGHPYGVVTYYGVPTNAAAPDPLNITPDVLGRVARVDSPDGAYVTYRYCGPHVEVTKHDVATDLTGGKADTVTRYYYNGLGKVAVIDNPIAIADEVYRYDARGNVTNVDLVANVPSNPFKKWREHQIPQPDPAQSRQFAYDAAGRLLERITPEAGRTIYGWLDSNGGLRPGYDSAGKLLVWQDERAIGNGYFFKNTYDASGRLTTVERITGTPNAPSPAAVNRVANDGLLSGTTPSGWQFGTLNESTGVFTAGPSYWKSVPYAGLCVGAAPDPDRVGTTHSYVLYFGDATACNYTGAPAEPQAVRTRVAGVTRGDSISFDYWRQVRSTSGSQLDTFTVYVVLENANPNDMSDRRVALRLDSRQTSFAQWQRSFIVHPGDLWTASEWGTGTKTVSLVFVFAKGDTIDPGAGGGVLIDNVFVGRRSYQVAKFEYDQSFCGDGTWSGARCQGQLNADYAAGQLTTVTTYVESSVSGSRPVSRKRLAYRGAGGKASAVEQWFDVQDGVGAPVGDTTFLTRYLYDEFGAPSSVVAPYRPDVTDTTQIVTRKYDYSYARGAFMGVTDSASGRVFVSASGASPSVTYWPNGSIQTVDYSNGVRTTSDRDDYNRLSAIIVEGMPGNRPIWNSGQYQYDGTGNIMGIGTQEFAYDLAGQLKSAVVFAQTKTYEPVTPYTITYGYDSTGRGNMISRHWTGPANVNPPPGMEITAATYDAHNRRTDGVHKYDESGNLVRLLAFDGAPAATFWTDSGQLSTWFEGDPANPASRPGEQYVYGEDGRILRFPIGGSRTGEPEITVRGASGVPLAQYEFVPGSGMHLLRDYVYGAGQLLVERKAVPSGAPTLGASAPLFGAGGYGLTITDAGSPAGYRADIRTESGFRNQIDGIYPDAQGHFAIPESALSPGETNFIRVRSEDPGGPDYSAPVTLWYDPTVNGASSNQVRAVAVSRNGTNVVITWALNAANGKNFRVYGKRLDTGVTALLTPQSLPSGTMTLSFPSQSLSVQCFSIFVRQLIGNQTNTLTTPTGEVVLGSGETGAPTTAGACTAGAVATTSYVLTEFYQHRDHLGSARIVTDNGGVPVARNDYYPFGQEMDSPSDTSRMKFTGQERDDSTSLDYMNARYKAAFMPTFLSPDPIVGGQWNGYAYVGNNPISNTDPSGMMSVEECMDNDFIDVECGGDGGGGWGYGYLDWPRGWVGPWGGGYYDPRPSGPIATCLNARALMDEALRSDPAPVVWRLPHLGGSLVLAAAGLKPTYPNDGSTWGDGMNGINQGGLSQYAGRNYNKLVGTFAVVSVVGGVVVYGAGALLEGGAAVEETAAFGEGSLGAAEARVLQTGGNTLRKATIRALNEFAGEEIPSWKWRDAIHALKRFNRIPHFDHYKILADGEVLNAFGEAIDNLFNYIP